MMEGLTPREIVDFHRRMATSVWRGLMRAIEDIKWEHQKGIVDQGKSERAARQIQMVIHSTFWPDDTPEGGKYYIDDETGVAVNIEYHPFQHDVEDEQTGYDMDGNYHHPRDPFYDRRGERYDVI